MRTAEEKGKRARTDGAEDDGGEPIDRALLLSIEKLQEIQDEIEKVSRFVSQGRLGFFTRLIWQWHAVNCDRSVTGIRLDGLGCCWNFGRLSSSGLQRGIWWRFRCGPG